MIEGAEELGVRIDPAALDWIREHEPGRWKMFASARLRIATMLRRLGWLLTAGGVVQAAFCVWSFSRLSGPDVPAHVAEGYALSAFLAGCVIGLGQALRMVGIFLQLLAQLKGEHERDREVRSSI